MSPTGYESFGFPVLMWKTFWKACRASELRPWDIRNLGLSGMKNSPTPLNKLGRAHTNRKICQLCTIKQFSTTSLKLYLSILLSRLLKSTKSQSLGKMAHAKRGSSNNEIWVIMPTTIST